MSSSLEEIAGKINKELAGSRFVKVEVIPGYPPSFLFTFDNVQEQSAQMTIQPAMTVMPDPGKVVAIPSMNFGWKPFS